MAVKLIINPAERASGLAQAADGGCSAAPQLQTSMNKKKKGPFPLLISSVRVFTLVLLSGVGLIISESPAGGKHTQHTHTHTL